MKGVLQPIWLSAIDLVQHEFQVPEAAPIEIIELVRSDLWSGQTTFFIGQGKLSKKVHQRFFHANDY